MFAVIFALGVAAAQIHRGCNAADQAKTDQIAQDLRKCFVEGNESTPELQACVAKDGYTKDCAGCITELGMCMAKKCESMCENGAETKHCRQCTEKNGKSCKTAFHWCSGIEKPIPETKLAAASAGCEKLGPKCFKTSQTAQGIASCFESEGFTAVCSQCAGTYGVCVYDKCGTQCVTNFNYMACKTCINTDKCLPALYKCTGFPKPPAELEAWNPFAPPAPPCNAGAAAEMAMKKAGAVLAVAKTDLISLEASKNPIVSEAAAFAYNALGVADQWILKYVSPDPIIQIAAYVCVACQLFKQDFNDMKAVLEDAAALLNCPEIKSLVDATVEKITAAFNFACGGPTPVTYSSGITSGTCASHGMMSITSSAECSTAQSDTLDNTKPVVLGPVKTVTDGTLPAGCWGVGGTKEVCWNTLTSAADTKPCSDKFPCYCRTESLEAKYSGFPKHTAELAAPPSMRIE